MRVGAWMVSENEEQWSCAAEFDTKEEAIKAGPEELDLEPGVGFWVGQVIPTDAHQMIMSAKQLLEYALDRAVDRWHESVIDSWENKLRKVPSSVVDELDVALEATFKSWLDKYDLNPAGFLIGKAEWVERTDGKQS